MVLRKRETFCFLLWYCLSYCDVLRKQKYPESTLDCRAGSSLSGLGTFLMHLQSLYLVAHPHQFTVIRIQEASHPDDAAARTLTLIPTTVFEDWDIRIISPSVEVDMFTASSLSLVPAFGRRNQLSHCSSPVQDPYRRNPGNLRRKNRQKISDIHLELDVCC